jgi:hypothetical protein
MCACTNSTSLSSILETRSRQEGEKSISSREFVPRSSSRGCFLSRKPERRGVVGIGEALSQTEEAIAPQRSSLLASENKEVDVTHAEE